MVKTLARSIVYFIRESFASKGISKVVNGIPCRFTARYARGVPSMIDIPMLHVFLSEAKSSNTVLELGGHIGTWSELIANVMPEKGKLYVFEPHPSNFAILKKQCRVSLSTHKIIPINKAVGDVAGILKFDARTTMGGGLDESAMSKIILPNEKVTHGKVIDVEVITVDDFCKDNNLIPDLIKVDIEGAELWALKGMKKILSHRKTKVIIEMHQFAWSSFNYSAKDFLQFVTELGGYDMHDNHGNLIIEAAGDWLDNNKVGYVTLTPKTGQ